MNDIDTKIPPPESADNLRIARLPNGKRKELAAVNPSPGFNVQKVDNSVLAMILVHEVGSIITRKEKSSP